MKVLLYTLSVLLLISTVAIVAQESRAQTDNVALQEYVYHARDTAGAREARLRLIFDRIGATVNKTLDVDGAVVLIQQADTVGTVDDADDVVEHGETAENGVGAVTSIEPNAM